MEQSQVGAETWRSAAKSPAPGGRVRRARRSDEVEMEVVRGRIVAPRKRDPGARISGVTSVCKASMAPRLPDSIEAASSSGRPGRALWRPCTVALVRTAVAAATLPPPNPNPDHDPTALHDAAEPRPLFASPLLVPPHPAATGRQTTNRRRQPASHQPARAVDSPPPRPSRSASAAVPRPLVAPQLLPSRPLPLSHSLSLSLSLCGRCKRAAAARAERDGGGVCKRANSGR
jgi:hypothetical protein